MKPRIYFCRVMDITGTYRAWVCTGPTPRLGERVQALGETPVQAYLQWRMFADYIDK